MARIPCSCMSVCAQALCMAFIMSNLENVEEGNFSFKNEIYSWAGYVAFMIAIVLILFIFGARVIGVDGSSMVPTLGNGDVIVTSKLFYSPGHGDVVVLNQKKFTRGPIVKRVIGLPGDIINIDYDLDTVTVNGILLDEPYINEPDLDPRLDSGSYPLTVPEGFLFVMGDNRNNSADSRSTQIGLVPADFLLGRALVRIGFKPKFVIKIIS